MAEGTKSIEINVLPAKNGDCIHIRFFSKGTWFNIVIDSGPGNCSGLFGDLLERIRERGEAVDLLCFTHIDDDHIRAAEKVLCRHAFDTSCIKMVWLNLPPSVASHVPTQDELDYCRTSVTSACELWIAIGAKDIPCQTIVAEGTQMRLGDAVVDILLPDRIRLDAFYKKWEQEEQVLRNRSKYILTSIGASDTSPLNGSSIVLMLTINGKKMLFTGDAFADDLANVAQMHAGDDGFFLVKLPHHGSDSNISTEMLNSFKCSHFLICTDQRPDRPSQATIDLLVDYGTQQGHPVILFGNYPWNKIKSSESGLQICQLPSSEKPVELQEILLFSEG